MSDNNSTFDKKMLSWLNSQGYPLEIAVAHAFEEAGHNVSLSDYYDDYETGQPREIDVTAHLSIEIDKPIVLQICSRIECKLATDKPWILFVHSNKRASFTSPPFGAICSELFNDYLKSALKNPDVQNTFKEVMFLSQVQVGYGVTQAFTSGQDIPYKAVMSSAKAAISRAQKFDKYFGFKKDQYFGVVAFPIVVIDGKLFEANRDVNGDIQVQEIESGMLLWKNPNPMSTSPLVHIVTRSGLNQFVKRITDLGNMLIKFALDNSDELFELSQVQYAQRIKKHKIG